MIVDGELDLAAAPRRDHRCDAASLHFFPDMVGVVAAIGQKDLRLWPVGVEERQGSGVVGGLARRDVDGYRETDSVGVEMNFGRKPTSRAPETLSRSPPPCAGGAVVCPDDGAVDHLDRLADAFGVVQHLEQQIPEPGERPSAELAVDGGSFTEELGQIPPLNTGSGNSKDAVESAAMITRRAAAVRPACRHEGLEESPFLVAHQASNQRRRPPKATLNHSAAPRGILFVNRT